MPIDEALDLNRVVEIHWNECQSATMIGQETPTPSNQNHSAEMFSCAFGGVPSMRGTRLSDLVRLKSERIGDLDHSVAVWFREGHFGDDITDTLLECHL